MSISAYIFIEATPGKSKEVAKKVGELTGVKSVHVVTRPYDVIAFAEAPDVHQMGELVIARIQNSPGVMKTLTSDP